jgi:cyclopropane fatty-acyl-phospholipid synthase-like methyltransferase
MSESVDNWDKHWDRYAASASQNPAQQMRHRLIVRWLKTQAGGRMRLFDIGCGQGDLLATASAQLPDAELLGVELSERGTQIARRKLPTANLFATDLLREPAELAPYLGWASHAVCSEVLEHVDDPTSFLSIAGRYLAADARIIVTVPGGPMSAFDRHIGHRQHFDRDSIRKVMTDSGFKAERVSRAGFPFFNLYRALVIARGKRLAEDVEGEEGASSGLARFVMRVFGALFRLTLSDAPLGWQIVAVARKLST